MNKKLKSFALASIILLGLTTISLSKTMDLSQNDPINPRPEINAELFAVEDPINPRPEVIHKLLCIDDPINPRPEIITELCLIDPINPRPEISVFLFS